MNHFLPTPLRSAAGRRAVLPVLALALAVGSVGCYHATGFQRPPLMASEIPATGGDRGSGLKSAAGPGDYYLGNDFVALAVDGTPFGEKEGSTIASAISGGSVVDAWAVDLDSSYKQVPLPSDMLERLTPVVNQDPELPVVFTSYGVTNYEDQAYLEMRGKVYDPKGRISGGSRDASGRLDGVDVTHRITLGKMDTFFILETTLKNNGASAVGIRSIGDALFQQGGGFRLNIPATQTVTGQPVQGWGTDFDGSDFSKPLDSSVKAPMVALMGTEPADYSTDMHTSLGLVSADGKPLVVAADAQKALTNFRPEFPRRMVAGSLPTDSLGAGQSLTHRRRFYIYGAPSTSPTTPYSNQATGLFNRMVMDQAVATDTIKQIGVLAVSPFGSASRIGGMPTMFRFERNTGTTDKPVWTLERTEWWEPMDTPGAGTIYSSLLGTSLSQSTFELALPVGSYRIVTYNGLGEKLTENQFHDAWYSNNRGHLLMPLVVDHEKPFAISTQEALCPDRDSILTSNGSQMRQLGGSISLSASSANMTAFQPARFTLQGSGTTPDPLLSRQRVLTGTYAVAIKGKVLSSTYPGAYGVIGGNTLFAVNFLSPISVSLPLGSYRTYATHGPLAPLDLGEFTLDAYSSIESRRLVSFESGMPEGWVSFDVPGPTMATSGMLHPYESLSSALAEAVNVVGYTEQDFFPDIAKVRDEFRFEYDNPDYGTSMTTILGKDPFMVGGRTSVLEGRDAAGALKSFGTATALFDLSIRPGARRNGARISSGWTLADFLGQGGGSFTVVHDPRGPKGLFTSMGFDRTVALGTGVNAWWTRTSSVSNGRAHGTFDAIELLRGEGCSLATSGAWWNTFKTLRQDWFALLNQQTPTAFTKALGLSSARTTMDTPVGLARTYVKATGVDQDKLSLVKEALQKGAAVASTGPLLDVAVNGSAPGTLATGASLSIVVSVFAPDWVPVDEVRVVWNGQVVKTLKAADFTFDTTDVRKRTATVTLAAPKDGWVVVEAGAPLDATAPYRAGSSWSTVMKGILPVAVTNPIFVDANGGGYTAPGL